ncbi:uncharacterized protein LOC135108457 isoform X2 [Scylla paramamosain]|uniref:uncharacterized protein LOC135108457 isoform X2 n=1 Tax=Scylla paramamosain TaxID=85552 RepID=UPI003082A658
MKYVTYVSQRTCGSPPVTSSRTWDSLGSSVSSSIFTIPQDLFIDTVESNNFISSALTGLFANTEDSTARLPSPLVLEALGNGGEEGRGMFESRLDPFSRLRVSAAVWTRQGSRTQVFRQ